MNEKYYGVHYVLARDAVDMIITKKASGKSEIYLMHSLFIKKTELFTKENLTILRFYAILFLG